MKIAVITAQFNLEITEKLEAGALTALREVRIEPSHVLRVPGAVEIPLAAKFVFDQGCDAVIALGCVIRGETTHYDSVCRMVESGCNDVMLRYGRPISFGVITTENEQQALERAGGSEGNKGADAAQVAIEMLNLLRQLQTSKRINN